MKSIKVMWNGKHLRDIYPHATSFQVFKWKVGKFFRKAILTAIVLGIIYLGFYLFNEFNATKYVADINVVQKTTDNELERIMNEENFKAITILRARKVASDQKMALEIEKNKAILEAEKARHDSILAQIEAENEAIRAEELTLVGSPSLK